MNYLVFILLFLQCYTSFAQLACGGRMTTSPCQQMQTQCPSNTVYSNGVCVAQQYMTAPQPFMNYVQAPTSCGANSVLYNGRCQSQNVATCPYATSLQNGICSRNQVAQPYTMTVQQNYQLPQTMTVMQPAPQPIQIAQPLPQPMPVMQPAPQPIQITQPMPVIQPIAIPQPMPIMQPAPQPIQIAQPMPFIQPAPQPVEMIRFPMPQQSYGCPTQCNVVG